MSNTTTVPLPVLREVEYPTVELPVRVVESREAYERLYVPPRHRQARRGGIRGADVALFVLGFMATTAVWVAWYLATVGSVG